MWAGEKTKFCYSESLNMKQSKVSAPMSPLFTFEYHSITIID